jgi:hypothetical protein
VAGVTLAGIFAGAAARVAAQAREEETKMDTTLPIIDVVAEPVTESDMQSKPALGNEPIDW